MGQAFILLLQMPVLPDVAVSLITGLGKLTAADALSLEPGKPPDFLALFIPSNPFYSLSEAIVPDRRV